MQAVRLVWIMVVLSGCASSILYTEERLRRRAAFDLDCPEDQITIVELDGSNRGVQGCGHRGSYIRGPDGWILNSIDGKMPNEGR